MIKRFLSLLLVFAAPLLLFAQSPDLMVQGVSPDLYVVHTVAPKENWYSVGRLFNLSPKEIAPLNGKTLATPLNIGEQLKVPLNATNFSQNNTKASDEVFIPVYHLVQDKEWMYRISSNYNKVPVENLEKWNNLGKDGARAGSKLIIGYLKVKKDQSVAAASAATPAPVNATPAPAANPTGTTTPVTNPANNTSQSPRTQPVTSNTPVETRTTETKPAETKPAETKTAETKPAETRGAEPVTRATLPASNPVAVQQPIPGDSYFKGLYEASGKSATGVAGIFKSVSGWQDKKFYALMNGVSVGTIVRVTNPGTGKTVFAKVLGQLPEMKESAGLTLRISDAAAAELGATVTKLSVQVAY